jgi:hypothetical protein
MKRRWEKEQSSASLPLCDGISPVVTSRRFRTSCQFDERMSLKNEESQRHRGRHCVEDPPKNLDIAGNSNTKAVPQDGFSRTSRVLCAAVFQKAFFQLLLTLDTVARPGNCFQALRVDLFAA